eukprot:gene16079-21836_t
MVLVETIIGYVVLVLTSSISASAGVGGGGLNVPILLLLFHFSLVPDCIIYSLCIVLGNALAQCLLNISITHPINDEQSVILWAFILIALPAQLGGGIIGSILSKILPDSLLFVFALLFLLFASNFTFYKGMLKYKYEQIAIENEKQQKSRINQNHHNNRLISSGSNSSQSADILAVSNSISNSNENINNINTISPLVASYDAESPTQDKPSISTHNNNYYNNQSSLSISKATLNNERIKSSSSLSLRNSIKLTFGQMNSVDINYTSTNNNNNIINNNSQNNLKNKSTNSIFSNNNDKVFDPEKLLYFTDQTISHDSDISQSHDSSFRSILSTKSFINNDPYMSSQPTLLSQMKNPLSIKWPITILLSIGYNSSNQNDINLNEPIIDNNNTSAIIRSTQLTSVDIDFKSPTSYYIPIISFVIGIVSALLGIGGGELFGPLLLSYSVLPQCSSATTSMLDLLNSIPTLFRYMMSHEVDYLLGIGFFVIGLIGGLFGRSVGLIISYVYHRSSVIIFSLGIVLYLAAIYYIIQLTSNPFITHTHSYC